MNLSIVEDDGTEIKTPERSTPAIARPSARTEEVPQTSGPVRAERLDTEKPTDDERPATVVDDNADQKLNQTELAKLFKLSRNVVIERLKEAGIEPISQGGKGGTKYWLSEVREVLTLNTYMKSDRKLEATERKLEAEAGLKELELEKRRGEFLPVSELELGAVQLFRALHNRFNVYFADSALDISRLRTRGEVEAYQKEHGGLILQELRDDPNNLIAKYSSEDDL